MIVFIILTQDMIGPSNISSKSKVFLFSFLCEYIKLFFYSDQQGCSWTNPFSRKASLIDHIPHPPRPREERESFSSFLTKGFFSFFLHLLTHTHTLRAGSMYFGQTSSEGLQLHHFYIYILIDQDQDQRSWWGRVLYPVPVRRTA